MKSFLPYLFIIFTIIFNALTNLAFKFSSLRNDSKSMMTILFIIGLLFGLANSYFYFRSLKTFNLNTLYLVVVGSNTIILTILAYLLFNENFTFIKAIGMVLIICGIFLIGKF
jgi:multidrug transporter EmrE-like cation transporter